MGFVNIFCDGYHPVGGIFLRNFLKKAILHPEHGATDLRESAAVQLLHTGGHPIGGADTEEDRLKLHPAAESLAKKLDPVKAEGAGLFSGAAVVQLHKLHHAAVLAGGNDLPVKAAIRGHESTSFR